MGRGGEDYTRMLSLQGIRQKGVKQRCLHAADCPSVPISRFSQLLKLGGGSVTFHSPRLNWMGSRRLLPQAAICVYSIKCMSHWALVLTLSETREKLRRCNEDEQFSLWAVQLQAEHQASERVCTPLRGNMSSIVSEASSFKVNEAYFYSFFFRLVLNICVVFAWYLTK